MSGIEGAEVKIYREVEKPEALVAEGLTDERGFFKKTLPPAKYIIVVTWVDEEGVKREIRKIEELISSTELMVNLPKPVIAKITIVGLDMKLTSDYEKLIEAVTTVALDAKLTSDYEKTISPTTTLSIEAIPTKIIKVETTVALDAKSTPDHEKTISPTTVVSAGGG